MASLPVNLHNNHLQSHHRYTTLKYHFTFLSLSFFSLLRPHDRINNLHSNQRGSPRNSRVVSPQNNQSTAQVHNQRDNQPHNQPVDRLSSLHHNRASSRVCGRRPGHHDNPAHSQRCNHLAFLRCNHLVNPQHSLQVMKCSCLVDS